MDRYSTHPWPWQTKRWMVMTSFYMVVKYAATSSALSFWHAIKGALSESSFTPGEPGAGPWPHNRVQGELKWRSPGLGCLGSRVCKSMLTSTSIFAGMVFHKTHLLLKLECNNHCSIAVMSALDQSMKCFLFNVKYQIVDLINKSGDVFCRNSYSHPCHYKSFI